MEKIDLDIITPRPTLGDRLGTKSNIDMLLKQECGERITLSLLREEIQLTPGLLQIYDERQISLCLNQVMVWLRTTPRLQYSGFNGFTARVFDNLRKIHLDISYRHDLKILGLSKLPVG